MNVMNCSRTRVEHDIQLLFRSTWNTLRGSRFLLVEQLTYRYFNYILRIYLRPLHNGASSHLDEQSYEHLDFAMRTAQY